MSVTKDSNASFAQFMMNLLNLENLSFLDINCQSDHITISLEQNLDDEITKPKLKECNITLAGDYNVLNDGLELLFIHLTEQTSLQNFGLYLGKSIVEDYKPVVTLPQIILNSTNLQVLDFQLAKSSPEDEAHIQTIVQAITQQKQLKTVYLLLRGNSLLTDEMLQEEICSGGDHSLEEFTLTLLDYRNAMIREIPSFLSCFPQLKKLSLLLYKVQESYASIDMFFHEMDRLQSLEHFSFCHLPSPQICTSDLLKFKALLPNSVIKPTLIFDKLDMSDLSSLQNILSQDEIEYIVNRDDAYEEEDGNNQYDSQRASPSSFTNFSRPFLV